jgi:glutamate 5-kinase
MSPNAGYPDTKTLVVKIGTALLSDGIHGFQGLLLEEIVKDLARVKHARGLNLLVVSSGAMGCGMERLGMSERPALLPVKQATAAVGQARLMHYYEALFQTYGDGLRTAQVLLSAADLDDRASYLNVRNTVRALLDFENVVPIVNENDSIATQELKFGDNDTLAAKMAAKIDADLLIILSNVDGLYDSDPGANADAALLKHVDAVTPEIEAMADGPHASHSIGGMRTKLDAARIACSSGLPMAIASGLRPGAVSDVLDGKGPMTTFGSAENGLTQRKRWIAFGRSPRGALRIDRGARDALVDCGKSLLPAGIVSVEGAFGMGEAVTVKDPGGLDVARGLTNYTSEEIDRIKGCQSGDIEGILGYKDYDVVIQRDNLVLL